MAHLNFLVRFTFLIVWVVLGFLALLLMSPLRMSNIKKKVINPKPKIKVNKISSTIASIDADNSVGFVGADAGINLAIQNAKKNGIGFVAVKKSGHFGLSGYYAERAAKKG